jgi:hypothetical protein
VVPAYHLERQLDELSPAEFESLKQLQGEINRAFKRWSLSNHPDHCGGADADGNFARISGIKELLFQQIKLQEDRRWTQDLVRGRKQQKELEETIRSKKSSLLQRVWRRKLHRDRFRAHKNHEKDLKALTAVLIAALEGADAISFRNAWSNLWLECGTFSDNLKLSSGLSMASPIFSVLVCGMEGTLAQILSSVMSACELADFKETVSITSTGTSYSGILHCLDMYRYFQRGMQEMKSNHFETGQELLRAKSSLQNLQRDLELMNAELESERNLLKQSTLELSKIRDEIPEECRAGGNDFIAGWRKFMSIFQTNKSSVRNLEAENRELKAANRQIQDENQELKQALEAAYQGYKAFKSDQEQKNKVLAEALEQKQTELAANNKLQEDLKLQLEETTNAMAQMRQQQHEMKADLLESKARTKILEDYNAEFQAKGHSLSDYAVKRDMPELLQQHHEQRTETKYHERKVVADVMSHLEKPSADLLEPQAYTRIQENNAIMHAQEHSLSEKGMGDAVSGPALDESTTANASEQGPAARAVRVASVKLEAALPEEEVAWVAAAVTRLDREGTNGLMAADVANKLNHLVDGGVSEQQVLHICTLYR